MFNLSLETAMRPMDLCQFPYIGNGKNAHIAPYSDMNENTSTIDFHVLSKGSKFRTVKINIKALAHLEQEYIFPHYIARKKLYEEKYGKKCPPSILFLTKFGDPVTPQKISDRTNYAKKKALKVYPPFREKMNFYEARHWWPTMFLIIFFKEKLLTQTADALYAAAAQAIANQMGHDEIATTFKHYIDKSRLIAMAHKGLVNEIISNPAYTTREFVQHLGGP
jgi:integrase